MGADIFHPKLNSNRLVVPVLQKKYNGIRDLVIENNGNIFTRQQIFTIQLVEQLICKNNVLVTNKYVL